MKKFFHSTTTKKELKSILEEGLRPSKYHLDRKMKYPGVFLSNDPFWSTMFGEYVIEVEIPDKKLLFKVRSTSAGVWEYIYRGYIPPEYLEFYSESEPIRLEAEKEGTVVFI